MIAPQARINARAAYISRGQRSLATLRRWTVIAAIALCAIVVADMALTLTTDLPPLLQTAAERRAM